MGTNYPFPLLDIKELIQNYRQQLPEIDLTEQDFSHPKTDRWQAIYTVILGVLTETPMEQIMQPSLDCAPDLEHPELFEDALPLYRLAICMKRVMIACGVEDFTLRDINNPTPKRLQRNLSALLNFLYFKTQRMEVYDSIKENNAAQLKMRETTIKENMDFKTEINRIRTERSEQEPAIQEYKLRTDELESLLESLQETTSNKRNNLTEIRMGISEKQAKIAELKGKIAEAKEDGAALSKKIVHSPKRMKENMSRMTKKVEELKEAKERNKVRLLELQAINENSVEAEGYVDQAMELQTKIKVEMELKKQKIQETQVLRDRLLENRNELQNLEVREQQLSRIILTKQEKQSKMSLANANKKQSLENTLQMLREEKDIIQGQQSEEYEQKEKIARLLQELGEGERKAITKHQTVMGKGDATYLELLEQFEQYHVALGEALHKTQTCMNTSMD